MATTRETSHTNILNMAGTDVIDDNSSDSDGEIIRILETKTPKIQSNLLNMLFWHFTPRLKM